MIVCILGRQPRLASAELEALYGAERVRLLAGLPVALVDVDEITQELGGTIKIARQLDALPVTKFDTLVQQLKRRLPQYVRDMPSEGKVKLGVSVYGLNVSLPELTRTSLYFKQTLKRAGRSVRAIPNTELALNSAQVIHNQLTSPLGLELLLIRDGDSTIIARTLHEQDIEAYTLRDRGRPKRDALVGMLPPKLAQIMIHLAGGQGARSKEQEARNSQDSPAALPVDAFEGALESPDDAASRPDSARTKRSEPAADSGAAAKSSRRELTVPEKGSSGDAAPPVVSIPTLLDPFCGTGVVLQEAALEGCRVYGTDISERMVRFTRDNLNWLVDTHHITLEPYYEVADATTHTWQQPIDLVVCEGYLGQPMSQAPPREKLESVIHGCNAIMRDFLKNIAPQLKPGTRLCVGAPAWFIGNETKHLPCLDDLEKMGYQRREFTHASTQDLIYHREDQIVGRELLVLTKI